MSSPMRRGLTPFRQQPSVRPLPDRRNEFPDEKGIDTLLKQLIVPGLSSCRNEFPDEKGIDTIRYSHRTYHSYRRNEFPDEKGIDTSSCLLEVPCLPRRNEFPDEKGIDTRSSLLIEQVTLSHVEMSSPMRRGLTLRNATLIIKDKQCTKARYRRAFLSSMHRTHVLQAPNTQCHDYLNHYSDQSMFFVLVDDSGCYFQ